jgi:DNA mismatch endonuclease (patch repair protein)
MYELRAVRFRPSLRFQDPFTPELTVARSVLLSLQLEMPETRIDDIAASSPSYLGLKPASAAASAAARGSSLKADTRCEVKVRSLLWRAGARFRKNVGSLPGKPDIVFAGPRLAVFCDGDFWHGKDWDERRRRLAEGTNAPYWLAKIERNRQRDLQNQRKLESEGWTVLRFWEAEIHGDPRGVAERILAALSRLDSGR